MDSHAPPDGLLCIGRPALHRWRDVLERTVGEQAPQCLQEIGAAVGAPLFDAFCRWLPEHTGLDRPDELDAGRFGEVLSRFLGSVGWGAVAVERLGTGGLSLTSTDWPEAEPGAGRDYPACFVSAGLLADFLSRLADAPLAIMEVECRSRDDAHCRFFAGAPETLQAVYDAMTAGRDYRPIFGA